MKVGALCAGYGGLELGLQTAGVDVDLCWYAEIDKHASQVMAHHHPSVPNLGDLTQIGEAPRVELVAAGFPCQPVSHAGKRKGVDDHRWLIDDVCRVARRADARWLLLENVAGIFMANRGEAFFRVLTALAENGFDAEWTSVRASDVGAPHQRLRWFLLANADNRRRKQRDEGVRELPVVGENGLQPAADTDGDGHGARPHTRRMGRLDGEDAVGTQERERARSVVGDRGDAAAADTERIGAQVPAERRQPTIEMFGGAGTSRRTDFGPYADAIARWEPVVGRPAPEPTDGQRRLNPRFVEWMMGLEDGWVCDAVDGRSHQLRILGNGVVPQQAAYAITLLAR